MQATSLARMNDRLTVWERIPLLIAAEARGDDAEYRRLFAASPLRTWRFSEHLMAEQALHILALIYVSEQLDAAASYFYGVCQMQTPNDPCPEDWLLIADACAYFFVENADAWRSFCFELDIEPDALTTGNHRGWLLRSCQDNMRENAPTAEALQARFRDIGEDVPQLVTADILPVRWRDLLQAMTSHAPREAGKGKR